jgi:hypothetical protein
VSEPPPRKYWFPAKRYGWGWGLPLTWQGWVVMVVWLAVLGGGLYLLAPRPVGLHVLFVAVMIAILTVVCYAKGEPPRWRWGDQDDGRPPPPAS